MLLLFFFPVTLVNMPISTLFRFLTTLPPWPPLFSVCSSFKVTFFCAVFYYFFPSLPGFFYYVIVHRCSSFLSPLLTPPLVPTRGLTRTPHLETRRIKSCDCSATLLVPGRGPDCYFKHSGLRHLTCILSSSISVSYRPELSLGRGGDVPRFPQIRITLPSEVIWPGWLLSLSLSRPCQLSPVKGPVPLTEQGRWGGRRRRGRGGGANSSRRSPDEYGWMVSLLDRQRPISWLRSFNFRLNRP